MTDLTITAPVAAPLRARRPSLLAAAAAPFRKVWLSYTAQLAADPFIIPNGAFARAS